MDSAVALTGAVAALAALLAAALTRLALLRRVDVARADVDAAHERADARDERLARREETLDAVLTAVQERERRAEEAQAAAAQRLDEAERLAARHAAELQDLAGLTAEEARHQLLDRELEAVRRQARRLAADLDAQAREHAEHRARDIICTAVQRLALSTATPATTVVVPLREGELKSRIIGKEGRNIRTFEERTGVNLVVDDIPDAVVLSCFDPRRREVARLALTELLDGGKIYPSTIEEQVAIAEERMQTESLRAAREAAEAVRIGDLHPELLGVLGELYLRTSYGQHMLQHSVEVAHLCGLMAHELGLDPELARRAGLLHDIGKARGHEEEGSHARLGAELAARYGEPAEVCHAIEAHHGEVEARTAPAVLVQAADIISLSRPGGRREHLEQHMTRLRQIEEVCQSFEGVQRAHAMQAGREIRVMVSPERVGDDEARELARRIAARVEGEIGFPGRVSVTVVRELRATEIVR